MKVTDESIRAAYRLIQGIAFDDIRLPKRIKMVAKPLKKAWGYYSSHPHTIEIDSRIKDSDKFVRIVAHEMCHAALEQNAACDHEAHDENFIELSNLICQRMGWKKGSV